MFSINSFLTLKKLTTNYRKQSLYSRSKLKNNINNNIYFQRFAIYKAHRMLEKPTV